MKSLQSGTLPVESLLPAKRLPQLDRPAIVERSHVLLLFFFNYQYVQPLSPRSCSQFLESNECAVMSEKRETSHALYAPVQREHKRSK